MNVAHAAYCMIFVTCGSSDEAEKIARMLVEERAAACVQMAAITSIYSWKGSIEKSGEVLLVIKTKTALYGHVETLIRRVHSYDVPEIAALPIMEGLQEYIAWIDEATK